MTTTDRPAADWVRDACDLFTAAHNQHDPAYAQTSALLGIGAVLMADHQERHAFYREVLRVLADATTADAATTTDNPPDPHHPQEDTPCN
jgi:hypothetical protein